MTHANETSIRTRQILERPRRRLGARISALAIAALLLTSAVGSSFASGGQWGGPKRGDDQVTAVPVQR